MTDNKLHVFPGAMITPEVALHRTLEEVDEIESITISVKFKDGLFGTRISSADPSDVLMMTTYTRLHVEDYMRSVSE